LTFADGNDKNDHFWLVHGIKSVRPLKIGIEDVKEFLRKSPDIVILDFHTFSKKVDKRHSLGVPKAIK